MGEWGCHFVKGKKSVTIALLSTPQTNYKNTEKMNIAKVNTQNMMLFANNYAELKIMNNQEGGGREDKMAAVTRAL